MLQVSKCLGSSEPDGGILRSWEFNKLFSNWRVLDTLNCSGFNGVHFREEGGEEFQSQRRLSSPPTVLLGRLLE